MTTPAPRDLKAIPERDTSKISWTYEQAFIRNRGIIASQEQERLRTSRVAIVGMGGVGGIDLVTLARLGVGRFTIADPDKFETANTNRQFGAMHSTMGRSKAQVMAEIVRDINPEVDVRVFEDPIGPRNVDEFLRDAELFVDAVEFFEMDVRRLLFRKAAAAGIYGITAGPVGFSGIWIVFDPAGMSFDRYFDISDDMDDVDKLVAFAVGVAPKATQRSYMNIEDLDLQARTGPSSAAACNLAAGAVGCQAVKILLQKGEIKSAPHYQQLDPYVGRFVSGRLRGGNRHPLQRMKRKLLTRYFHKRCNQQQASE